MRHYWLTSDAPDLPGNAFQKAFGRNRPTTLEGGKGGGSPAAPDPYVTAAATTQTNEQTAAYNKALNATNYSNPFGSQSTTQIGTDPTTGAAIYGSTITANPQLQSQLNGLLGQTANSGAINQQALSGLSGLNSYLGGIGNQAQGIGNNLQGYAQGALGLNPQYQALSSNLGNLTGQYGNLNGQYGALGNQYAALGSQLNQGAAQQAQQQGQNAAYAAQTQYLDPQFAQQGESLSAQLANQGLSPGSQAYNNAMTNFNNQKQQAYSNAQNQAIMTGSQIGAQNLQNQISGINTQSGLLGAQAGMLGQQGANLGNIAGLYGQQGNMLSNQAGLYGLAGQLGSGQLSALGTGLNSASQQAGLFGQQVGIGQTPYSNLNSIASMIPGYTGTGQSNAAAADIAGNINNAYQGQLASHNADVSSANSTTGAIAGLAGAAAMAFF